jgi:hypothetical protein
VAEDTAYFLTILNLSEPFDACIWAMAACAFFGMKRFGGDREVSVASRNAFSGAIHLKHSDVFIGSDLDGKCYARLDLPSAKTARPGEIQSIYLTAQGDLCPLEALANLAQVVPTGPNDPLLSWRDKHSENRPMVKTKALLRGDGAQLLDTRSELEVHRFSLPKESTPKSKSLAYEAYIRVFEQIASRHMSNLSTQSA